MKELPTNISLPSKKDMEKYLDTQDQNVKEMNFKALFNLEVQKKRLESAESEKRYDDAGKIEEEIEETNKALEGNKEYLEEIEKMRKLV